jgi:hypothetical protein
MYNRTSLFVSAVILTTLTMRLPALAAETSAGGPNGSPPEGTEHRVPKKAVAQQAAPRPAEADDPYRCHPSEDISCTVVRETAQGTLIVTMRPKGQSALTPAWMVVSGAPPSPGPHPAGTIYVVPNTANPESVPR